MTDLALSYAQSSALHMQSPRFQRLKSEAIELIASCASNQNDAVVLSSFGKESLVLLELSREAGVSLPIGYFELGLVRRKHLFAQRVIATRKLDIIPLHPHRTSQVRGLNDTSLAYGFNLVCGSSFRILVTFEEGEEQNFICGLHSPVLRSGDHPPYPWNMLINGRRRTDRDVSLGSLRWGRCVEPISPHSSIVMPLLNWEDKDVYYYLSSRQIDPDYSRYEQQGASLRSRVDMQSNPDHAPFCIRCLAAKKGASVACPKIGSNVISFSEIPEDSAIVPNNVIPAAMC